MIGIEDKLLDLEPQKPKSLMAKKWKLWILCLGIVFSITSVATTYLRHLERFVGNKLIALQLSIGAIIAYVFILPIAGLLLALLFNLFPVKGYTYKRKYWAFALCTILLLQSFACFVNVYSYFDNPPQEIKDIRLD